MNNHVQSEAGSMEEYLQLIDSRAPKDAGVVDVQIGSLKLKIRENVWNPALGKSTTMMMEAMDKQGVGNAESAIDVGTGSGVLGIKWKLDGIFDMTLADNDITALRNATENAQLNGVQTSMAFSDLLYDIRAKFDRVLFNAPATHPLRRDAAPHTQGILWSPEENIIVRFLRGLESHLKPRGKALLMYSKFDDFDPLPSHIRQEFKHFSFTPVVESAGEKSVSQVLEIGL